MLTARERYWRAIKRRGDSDCWPGPRNIRVDGKLRQAHRYGYELAFGEPAPKNLARTCGDLACHNPRHFTAQTAKAHCIHGHEYTAENTLTNTYGHRYCRTCFKVRTALAPTYELDRPRNDLADAQERDKARSKPVSRLLIERCQKGDNNAWSDLLLRIDSQIRAVAKTDDHYQDCLAALYQGLPDFAWQSSFETWVQELWTGAIKAARYEENKWAYRFTGINVNTPQGMMIHNELYGDSGI